MKSIIRLIRDLFGNSSFKVTPHVLDALRLHMRLTWPCNCIVIRADNVSENENEGRECHGEGAC